MEDMAQDFGWDLDDEDFFEPLSSEEDLERERRQADFDARAEMMWEMQNAQYCFD